MCCLKKSPKKVRRRRNNIYPKPNSINNFTYTFKDQENFVKNLDYETLECNHCKNKFPLNSNEIKINCAECDKFFHCNIAGYCVGPNCIIKNNNTTSHSHYCLDCVNSNLKINIENNKKCLCNECYNDINTPNEYKITI